MKRRFTCTVTITAPDTMTPPALISFLVGSILRREMNKMPYSAEAEVSVSLATVETLTEATPEGAP